MQRSNRIHWIFGGLFLGFGFIAYLCMLAGLLFLNHLFLVDFLHSFAAWGCLAFPAVVGLFGAFLLQRARKGKAA